ncbi:DUF5368 family protein [Stella sp.]|uniref:DUF5368 family protein n=1 Tax=Stella sp. TaxID=2912054 RepID=UPI0035AEB7D4
MRDFDPLAILSIVEESMGILLWPAAVLAAALLAGVLWAAIRLRRSGRPARRPLAVAVVAALAATAGLAFAVPAWTLAGVDALNGPVDYLFAVLMALAPAAGIAALVFVAAALRCTARRRPAAS